MADGTQMPRGIYIKKIWSDSDILELAIETSDDISSFSNKIYVGHQLLRNTISELDKFKLQIHLGIYDLRFGEFGQEYAGGAFHARLHFRDRGKIYITIKAESDFKMFSLGNVAHQATQYIISEPALLDNFISELKQLAADIREDATMLAI